MATPSRLIGGLLARMWRSAFCWIFPLSSVIAAEPQFSKPPANASPFLNLNAQDVVQEGFVLHTKLLPTIAVDGIFLLTSVEVRCKARWGDSFNFSTMLATKRRLA